MRKKIKNKIKKILEINTSILVLVTGILIFSGITSAALIYGIVSDSKASLVGYWPLDEESEKVGDNINTNGDFETGDFTDWSSYFNSGNGASGSKVIDSSTQFSGSYGAKITITAGGSVNGDINFSNRYMSIATGKAYRLSFAIKADFTPSSSVSVRVIKDSTPYTNCGLEETITLTSEWQTFDYTFVATNGFSGDTRIIFYLGSIGTGNVYIDNVSLKETKTTDKTGNENDG
ncbi:MAG: carbohydrate binding domain-containing protein, partial [Candidatus Pacebacteria bacterium]|nr:carbohydrate binding domain-containing protein [Candidatus Paceibacterota bacterium]